MIKYTREFLEPIVEDSHSFSEVARKIRIKPHGGTQHHIASRIRKFGISTEHFTGKAWSKGVIFNNHRQPASHFLKDLTAKQKRQPATVLRRSLLELGRIEECFCGQGTEWKGQPLVLQIDHINGNPFDHRPENLRFICPNCHTQTETYGCGKRRKQSFCLECARPICPRNETGFCQKCYYPHRKRGADGGDRN